MYRQAYYVRTSDDRVHRIEDTCAANAMGRALNDHRGLSVLACWSGGLTDQLWPGLSGRINYEVPNHVPAPKRVTREKPDKSCQLFDDYEVLQESNKARVAAGMGAIEHD